MLSGDRISTSPDACDGSGAAAALAIPGGSNSEAS
jgi:hypothetical protein